MTKQVKVGQVIMPKDRVSGWRRKDAVARSRRKTRLFPMRGMINRCLERTQRTGRPL